MEKLESIERRLFVDNGSLSVQTRLARREIVENLHPLAKQGVLKKLKGPGMSRACGLRESDSNALLQGAA